ncbi:winged helix-turn-helix domain-containing protein [Pluralibacter gergoviae]
MLSHIPMNNVKSVTIGDDIVFKPHKNMLQNIKTGNVATLNNIASLLFLYLLQNGKETSTRDEVLLNVFQQNGARATDANLNQHISSIRKALTSIGHLAEVIVTTPRIGFYISDEHIHIQVNDAEIASETKPCTSVSVDNEEAKVKSGQRITLVIALLTIIAVTFVWWWTSRSNPLPVGKISVLQTVAIDNCKAHILGNNKTDYITYEKAKSIIQHLDFKPDCRSTKDIYINVWESNYELITWKFSAECGFNQGYYHCLSKYQYIER